MSFAPSPGKTNDAVRFGTRASNAHRMTGSLALHGPLSCSYGATLVGGVITDTLNVSGAIDLDGVSSGTVAGPGSFLGVTAQGGVVLGLPDAGAASSFSGSKVNILSTAIFSNAQSLVLSGTISSSGGGTFTGDLFANDLNVSGTLTAASFSPSTVSGNVKVNVFNPIISSNSTTSLKASGSIVTAGLISGSAGATVAGTVILSKGTQSLITSGSLSSSKGISVLGTIITNTLQASSSIMSAGALTVTGTISSSAALQGHSLAIQSGATITGSTVIHGAITAASIASGTSAGPGSFVSVNTDGLLVLDAPAGSDSTSFSGSKLTMTGPAIFTNATSIKASGSISGSKGITVLGTVITNTLQASSSIMTAGALTVTGTISSSNTISGHALQVQAGSTLTGSLINHGDVTIQGALSSSAGAVFLGTVITNTLQASSSIMSAGKLTVTGTISSSAEGGFHTLKSQAGATLTGSLINHGAVTITNGTLSSSGPVVIGDTVTLTNAAALTLSGTISSSGGATFLGKVIAEDVNVSGTLTTAGAFSPSSISGNVKINVNNQVFCNGLNVSGTSVYADDLSSSAGATFLGTVIANTVQVSSSIMAAGALTVTGTISGSAEGGFHTLKSQAGTTLTGSLVNHGSVTIVNGTLSSSSPMVIGDTVTFTKAASIVTSGSVALAGTLSSSAASVIGGTVTLTNESGLSASGSAAFGGAAIDTDFGIVLPNNATTGRLKANSVVTYSSRQLKTNIEDIKDPINKIMSLRGVSYNWKDSGQPDIGLVAEEVKNIIPEVVHDSKDYMALDYSRLTSILIEAVKAQQSQILALTKEIDGLKNKK